MDSVTFWDRAAAKYATDPIADMDGYLKTRDQIAGLLTPKARVFELGCGTGSTALELASGVAQYRATDVSKEMIAIARGKHDAAAQPQLVFSVGDVSDMAGGGHDVALALNVLHLMPDLPEVIQQIYEALPAGGMLISKTSLLREGLWIVPLMIPVMRLIGKAPFVRSLRRDDVTQALERAGFTIEQNDVQKGMIPRVFVVARKPQ